MAITAHFKTAHCWREIYQNTEDHTSNTKTLQQLTTQVYKQIKGSSLLQLISDTHPNSQLPPP